MVITVRVTKNLNSKIINFRRRIPYRMVLPVKFAYGDLDPKKYNCWAYNPSNERILSRQRMTNDRDPTYAEISEQWNSKMALYISWTDGFGQKTFLQAVKVLLLWYLFHIPYCFLSFMSNIFVSLRDWNFFY